ncbi:uncharacterized protein LOC131652788 [Vicia villosa]|uniref:uncharacterized protein LOC131652788 n=1 Tax=Vicia villosa TaxID=3911 RepID=UPI00273B07F6|nr:uncharacterized protein LOC131652788 [Vicia villosa]
MYSNPPMDYPPSYHPWSIPPTYPTNLSFTSPTTSSFPSFPWELFTSYYTHGSSSPKLYLNHGYSPHQQLATTISVSHPHHIIEQQTLNTSTNMDSSYLEATYPFPRLETKYQSHYPEISPLNIIHTQIMLLDPLKFTTNFSLNLSRHEANERSMGDVVAVKDPEATPNHEYSWIHYNLRPQRAQKSLKSPTATAYSKQGQLSVLRIASLLSVKIDKHKRGKRRINIKEKRVSKPKSPATILASSPAKFMTPMAFPALTPPSFLTLFQTNSSIISPETVQLSSSTTSTTTQVSLPMSSTLAKQSDPKPPDIILSSDLSLSFTNPFWQLLDLKHPTLKPPPQFKDGVFHDDADFAISPKPLDPTFDINNSITHPQFPPEPVSVDINDNPFESWEIPVSLKDVLWLQKFSANNVNVKGKLPEIELLKEWKQYLKDMKNWIRATPAEITQTADPPPKTSLLVLCLFEPLIHYHTRKRNMKVIVFQIDTEIATLLHDFKFCKNCFLFSTIWPKLVFLAIDGLCVFPYENDIGSSCGVYLYLHMYYYTFGGIYYAYHVSNYGKELNVATAEFCFWARRDSICAHFDPCYFKRSLMFQHVITDMLIYKNLRHVSLAKYWINEKHNWRFGILTYRAFRRSQNFAYTLKEFVVGVHSFIIGKHICTTFIATKFDNDEIHLVVLSTKNQDMEIWDILQALANEYLHRSLHCFMSFGLLGAYTTSRTHDNASCLIFWERHIKKLSESIQILSNSPPQLPFKSHNAASLQPFSPNLLGWQLALKMLVNESLEKVLPIALKQVVDYEELIINVCETVHEDNMNKLFDVHVHIETYVPPQFGIRGNGKHLVVGGYGRNVAASKYSNWCLISKKKNSVQHVMQAV